jgi:60S ribosome subunit biogenesis protein NIP7
MQFTSKLKSLSQLVRITCFNLILGTCIGKFTKAGKFKLHITALIFLAKYAKYKIWVKPNGEQSYLYGNHIMKSHVLRITEDCPKNAGVVVYNVNDVPIGFGATAKSTIEVKDLEPTAIVTFNQADVGKEYQL